MPSPVGHSLIGLAVGMAYGLPRSTWRGAWLAWRTHGRFLLLAVLLANAPDVDYLPGLFVGDWNAFHHRYTHTLGWVVALGLAVWLWGRRREALAGRRGAAFIAVALLSHLLADVVTADGGAPYGIMFWWPFSDEYVIAARPLFWRLEKAGLTDIFQWHNVAAVAYEAALVLPVILLLAWYKLRPAPALRAGR